MAYVKCYSEVSRSSHRSFSVRKVLLEISQNSPEKTCVRASFLRPATLLGKRLWYRYFFCEFCEISKNTFSTEHLQTTAFEFLQKDIDKFNECQTNESAKKIHLRRKKGKHETVGNELKCHSL